MIILGIETTCDETGVGIVENGKTVLSNVVSSSAILQKKYSGVVPEVAAREQVKVIIPVVDEALTNAGLLTEKQRLQFIDAIAVAFGPGLLGSLLIGVETAKALALAWRKPLIPVNHLIGHVYANWLKQSSQLPKFPLVALIVSGGHTDLILMTDHDKFRWLGGTRDDAAGEVFDKVARILGLGYPGGPEIEEISGKWLMVNGKSNIKFPRPMINDDNFDFSFSGLKTSVVNFAHGLRLTADNKSQIAFEFQEAICDVLISKTIKAAKKFNARSIVVGGGVAANEFLRKQFLLHNSLLGRPVYSERKNSNIHDPDEENFERRSDAHAVGIYFPSKILSVDNGAMIAAAAFYQKKFVDLLKLQADPSLHFEI